MTPAEARVTWFLTFDSGFRVSGPFDALDPKPEISNIEVAACLVDVLSTLRSACRDADRKPLANDAKVVRRWGVTGLRV